MRDDRTQEVSSSAGEPAAVPFSPPHDGSSFAASEPATASPSPPGKRKTWLIVAIVLLLSCCLVGGGIFALLGRGIADAIKVDETLAEADAHMERALEIIVTAMEDSDRIDIENAERVDEAMREVVGTVRPSLEEARTAVAEAATAVQALSDEEVESTYLQATDEVLIAIDVLEEALQFLESMGSEMQLVVDATTSFNEGRSLLNDAIDQINRRSFDGGASSAREAEKRFQDAQAAFRTAHESVSPSMELDKAADHLDSHIEEARLTVEMADFGKAGRTSAFNDAIDRVNRLVEARGADPLSNMSNPDDIYTPVLFDMFDRIDERLTEAERLRNKVNELL